METNLVNLTPESDHALDFWNEPISKTRRFVRLSCFFVVACLFLLASFQILRHEGFTTDGVWLAALGFGVLALGIYQFLMVKEIIRYRTEITKVPFSYRLREAILWLFAGAGLSPIPILGFFDTPQALPVVWGFGVLATFLLGYGVFLLLKKDRLLTASKIRALNAAPKEEFRSIELPIEGWNLNRQPITVSQEKPSQPESLSTGENEVTPDNWPFEEPWWIRYPIAIGVVWLGYFCAFEWSNKLGWIAAALLWFIAAGLAREALLWVIGLGALALVGWGLMAGVAALPISLAIVLGAVIIALAIQNRP